MTLDPQVKKSVLRLFTYGLYALTVPDGTTGHGATVNWVMQVSFEPPLVAVSVEKTSRSLGLIREHRVFAVNVFGSDQRSLAGQLGRRYANSPDKFYDVAGGTGVTGAPLLSDALGHVECRVTGEVDAGDSVLFVAEVVAVALRKTGKPLTMEASGFRHAG